MDECRRQRDNSFKSSLQYLKKNFLWKKERFHFAGYRAQGLSIAGRMLYHLSYGDSTKLFSPIVSPLFLFSQKNFSNIYCKFHLVLNDVNSKSQVDRVDTVEFGYHGVWYTLLNVDIIDWNDFEKFVNIFKLTLPNKELENWKLEIPFEFVFEFQ